MTHEELKTKALQNESVRLEYELLAPEFALIDASTINLAEVVAGKAASISEQTQYENALPYYLRLSDAEVNLKAQF